MAATRSASPPHAVLDVIEDEKLCERANIARQPAQAALQSLIATTCPQIVDIRGLGFMNAVEFNDVKTPVGRFRQQGAARRHSTRA
jgi:4-aminobutyrate aminotransferase-like enzyme